MGNFTNSSWGLVQMKTNGEADSSQVSGNCRGRKEQFSLSHRTSMAILCTEYVKAHDARYHRYESFNECLCLYTCIMKDALHAWCNTTCLTATDSYESLWVLCTIIAQLMMQVLMRALAPLASCEDETKLITTSTKIQDSQRLLRMLWVYTPSNRQYWITYKIVKAMCTIFMC